MDVLFDVIEGNNGHLGLITLNRPKALNSLNPAMIAAMQQQLSVWAMNAAIKAVVIKAAEGRAFCAGGDLRQAYEAAKNKDIRLLKFFADEYELNKLIFHYPKPYIALMDGITMGGGAGISIHGSHRVATDKMLFAMPETAIGFFPDVGGTYFLPRLVGEIGMYLALTSARIDADDCAALGIAPFKLASDDLPKLINVLASTDLGDDANQSVTKVINHFQITPNVSKLMQQQKKIDQYFAADSVEKILATLESSDDPFAKETADILLTKSPTSLKVTFEALQRGKKLDFDACMQQEYYLVREFIQSHDFSEGIRAVLIDKDQQPKWQPDNLHGVTPDMIAPYFP